MTIIWCMVPEIWGMTDRIFCHFRPFFQLSPPNSPKNQNFEKMKKTHGDIIILHKRTKNHNYILYCSWDIFTWACNEMYKFLIHYEKLWKNLKKCSLEVCLKLCNRGIVRGTILSISKKLYNILKWPNKRQNACCFLFYLKCLEHLALINSTRFILVIC